MRRAGITGSGGSTTSTANRNTNADQKESKGDKKYSDSADSVVYLHISLLGTAIYHIWSQAGEQGEYVCKGRISNQPLVLYSYVHAQAPLIVTRLEFTNCSLEFQPGLPLNCKLINLRLLRPMSKE